MMQLQSHSTNGHHIPENEANGHTRGAATNGASAPTKLRLKCPKVVKNPPPEEKMRPSTFMADMSLGTVERLQRIREVRPPKIIEFIDSGDNSRHKDSAMDINEPLFQPFPSEAVFHLYEPFETHEVPLSLRNVDRVARRIKVVSPESPYFSVVPPKNAGAKIAPGMDVTYTIRFKPEMKSDYSCEIVCITEREKFVVPVRAIGARAMLDFPDEISFGSCPVKHSSTKTLLVRNIGDRHARFMIKAEDPFGVSVADGQLDVQGSMQIDITFRPDAVSGYSAELSIQYDTGECIYVRLVGSGDDANVRLEKTTLRLDNTYVSLSSQRTVRIFNRSDIMVHYCWKAAATEAEEVRLRERFAIDLDQTEKEEMELFREIVSADPTQQGHVSLLSRKFKNKRKAIANDRMQYSDDIYSIEPVEGDIWPNSQVEVTVVFRPQEAVNYTRTVYCDITGRETRLPLTLKGQGIGPKARFSFDALDIGSVFVNSAHRYEAVLENKGDIEVPFKLVPPKTLFGPKFTFTPSHGRLLVGSSQAVQIMFKSDQLGDFSEDFVWALEGSPENLTLNFSGKVVGPTFHFDAREIDFGTVSYGFINTASVSLVNTSRIEMSYRLHVPADGEGGASKEFEITNQKGVIPPQGCDLIQIDLTSVTLRNYEVALAVDVAGVGEEVLSIPLRAHCVVPEITMATPLLELGKCYLGYQYEKMVEMVNDTDLPARYELCNWEGSRPATPGNPVVAPATEGGSVSYECDNPRGIIAPHSTQRVMLRVTVHEMGSIEAVARFRIAGSEGAPLQVLLSAVGVGPAVTVDSESLDWGRVPVLKSSTRTLQLTNASLIPAEFQCSLAGRKSVFVADVLSGVIAPKETATIVITALLDDSVRFTDKLTVAIANGATYSVALAATGFGSTITCDQALESIDFGHHFSNRPCSREFVLENKGRRSQVLSWMVDKGAGRRIRTATIDASNNNNTNNNTNSSGTVTKGKGEGGHGSRSVFTVIPDRVTLEPGARQTVVLRGFSAHSQEVKEKLVCLTQIGKGTNKESIIELLAAAEFIDPLLKFSDPALTFFYEYQPDAPMQPQVKSMTIRNVSSLPLTATLRTSFPFQLLSQADVRLESNDEIPVEVRFDPAYKSDYHSKQEHGRLTVSYGEHPQKDGIDLNASVSFPNLSFETTSVDFRCVLNDTEATRTMEISNPGPLDVTYSWSFLDDERLQMGAPGLQLSIDDISQVFDIMPLRSTLKAGQTESVRFTFYGHCDGMFNAVAVCDVVGGPQYEISLSGQASTIRYEIDKRHVDFGMQAYREKVEAEVFILNSGRVAFDFSVLSVAASDSQGQPTRWKALSASPMSGHISPMTKQRIVVTFSPAVPEKFSGFIELQVAHFEPERITISGEGVFPRISLELPREDDGHIVPVSEDRTSDAERERLAVKRHAMEIVEKGLDRRPRGMSTNAPHSDSIGASLAAQSMINTAAIPSDTTHVRVGPKNGPTKPVLATYVLDFGNVVRGGSSKRAVRVHNPGHGAVTFTFDKRALNGTGFTVEPERIKFLPSGSEHIEVNVLLQTNVKTTNPGLLEVLVPVDILNGPAVLLRLRATVIVPDLIMSCDTLDFGTLVCGTAKVMTVQLHNTKPVPCEWRYVKDEQKAPPGTRAAQDKTTKPAHSFFTVQPNRGTLEPDQRVNVRVQFIPEGEQPYSAKLPIRIAMNQRPQVLSVVGAAVLAKAEISASVVELGPILPYSSGAETSITISNPHDFSIEVFSVDFDKQHLEEEELLRKVEGYDKGQLLLPPRAPGEGLPQEIVEAYTTKPPSADDAIGAAAAAAAATATATTTTAPGAAAGTGVPGTAVPNASTAANTSPSAAAAGAQPSTVPSAPSPTPGQRDTTSAAALAATTSSGGSTTPGLLANAAAIAGGSVLAQSMNLGSSSLAGISQAVPTTSGAPVPPTTSTDSDAAGKEHNHTVEGEGVGELVSPVQAAVNRYLASMSPNKPTHKLDLGVNVVVYGPPLSGKTTQSRSIAGYYGGSVISIDETVVAAMCEEGEVAGASSLREFLSSTPEGMSLLQGVHQAASTANAASVANGGDAATAHAAGLAAAMAMVASLTVPVVKERVEKEKGDKEKEKGEKEKEKEKGEKEKEKGEKEKEKGEKEKTEKEKGDKEDCGKKEAQQPPEPEPAHFVLPENVLVEVLLARFARADCQKAAIVDGLDTRFAMGPEAALTAVLRAFKGRRRVFFMSINVDQRVVHEREVLSNRQRSEEYAMRKSVLDWPEISEDEYDHLNDTEKEAYDERRKARKRILQEEMRRRMEEEKKEMEAAMLKEQKHEEERSKKSKANNNNNNNNSSSAAPGTTGGNAAGAAGGNPGAVGGNSGLNVLGVNGGPGGKDEKRRISINPNKNQMKRKDSMLQSAMDKMRDSAKSPSGGASPTRRSDSKFSLDAVLDKLTLSGEHKRTRSRMFDVDMKGCDEDAAHVTAMSARLVARLAAFELTREAVAALVSSWDRTRNGIPCPVPAPGAPVPPVPGTAGAGDVPATPALFGAKPPVFDRSHGKNPPQMPGAAAIGLGIPQPVPSRSRLGMVPVVEMLSPKPEVSEDEPCEDEGLDAEVPILDVDGAHDSEDVRTSIMEHLPQVRELEEEAAIMAMRIPPPALFSALRYPSVRKPRGAVEHFILAARDMSADDDAAHDQEVAQAAASSRGGDASATREGAGTSSRMSDRGIGSISAGDGTVGKKSFKMLSKAAAAAASSTATKPENWSKITKDLQTVTATATDAHDEDAKAAVYRWVIPPKGSVDVTVRFVSEEVGRFEERLVFETVGSGMQFRLTAKGTCQVPELETDLKCLFPVSRKTRTEEDIVHKEFIEATDTFEFGPLLCGKSRDKYKEGRFPGNMERFSLTNSGGLECNLSVCFQHDTTLNCFLLDPPNLTLRPGETKEVTIWAYPKVAGFFEDVVICCVKDNPDPLTFSISCHGVRPELELDKKMLSFDRLLLKRRETRALHLKNNTLLPVSWRLQGTDSLGEEFSVTPTQGTIEPKTECIVTAAFHATKPIVVKKAVRLEVSDVEKIYGVVQTETITVAAEAYDVAIDVHFPKNCDGGLDFGVIKVYEEAKHTCTLKNKGKYEIGFKFVFDKTETDIADISDMFMLSCETGQVLANDKPFPITVAFRAQREVAMRECPALKCLVMEPQTGELIATIPVKITLRTVFSRYAIQPIRDINFGAMVFNTKKSRSFTIENQGEFEFKYALFNMTDGGDFNRPRLGQLSQLQRNNLRTGSRTSLSKPPQPVKPPRRIDTKQESGRLTLGIFNVSPASGVVNPGSSQVVTVECHAETAGRFEELLGIDVSDRQPEDNPNGIEYKLVAESCVPGINTTEMAAVFEEHSVVRRLDLFNMQRNVYSEEDRVFLFGAFIAGQQAQVRFKISNPHKVPCDVVIACRPRSKTTTADFAFDVEPKRLSIPSHEHRYVTVVFAPSAMQAYTGIFEATVENGSNTKTKTLSFELRGEGTLPRVSIVKPLPRSGRVATPLLQFRRLLLGREQTLPLVLRNDGIIPATVHLDLNAADPASLRSFSCPRAGMPVLIHNGQSQTFNVNFHPNDAGRFGGELRMRVQDNQFEDTVIELGGEGYMDDVAFDNLPEEEESDLLPFGDCAVGESRSLSFTLSNHSSEAARFEFSCPQGEFTFHPMVGHVKARSSRQITVTFLAHQTQEYRNVPITCRVVKIAYADPASAGEWDDSARTVRWAMVRDERGKSQPKKVVEPEPEPAYEVIDELPTTELSLRACAIADNARFKCETTTVQFRNTLMYQTRAFSFPINNTGIVSLKYQWNITDDLVDDESPADIPFSVHPSSGVIEAGETAVFSVRFSPADVRDYECSMQCNVTNLDPSISPPRISLRGRSLRPFCHFEVEESDYITGGRRNPELGAAGGPGTLLDPTTRVIEFGSCGVRVRNTKKFYIVNPTNMTYEFSWECEDVPVPGQGPVFRCVTPKGTVLTGKKTEVVFEYTPETLDLVESFWRFRIGEHNIQIPFLLVGHADEPKVYLDRSNVNFRAQLLNHESKEIVYLINNESVPFSFAFSEASIRGDTSSALLSVSPLTGTVPPDGRIPVEVRFAPRQEKELNYNIVCSIKKKPTPVTLNVKGEGYAIHEAVLSELSDGRLAELVASTQNSLDFGEVQINERSVRQLTIGNAGKYNFDFSWKLDAHGHGRPGPVPISISPDSGTVLKGDRVVCEVTFHPHGRASTAHVEAVLKIANGPSYPIVIKGNGCVPNLGFSFTSHDFGPCFVHKPGMPTLQKSLQIINRDSREMSIDCLFASKPHLEVQAPPIILSAGESCEIPIVFIPRDAVHYHETINFEVNGLSRFAVEIKGSGTEFKLEPVNASNKVVAFGALRVGHTATRSIKLVNKSVVPMTFTIGPQQALFALRRNCVTVSLPLEYTLKPKATCNVELAFNPDTRLAPFTEEIHAESMGLSFPLFAVTGACQGIDIKLDNDNVPFGAVVQKSRSTRRVVIQNIGDVGARFKWDPKRFAPDFTISPLEGYISPGMELAFEVVFHPDELNNDVRYEDIPCEIEGSVPLTLTLTGMCVAQPPQSEVIRFNAAVRQRETKSITLTNKTPQRWYLQPIIDSEFWTGPESISIEPGQAKPYEIAYTPLTMTNDARHSGTVFFPLPDGSGLLYNLSGTADAPKPSGTINREVPCKTQYTELLPVTNWLKRPQRFKVSIEVSKPDSSTSLKGVDYIDVPGQMRRDYKLNFYAYKEGVTNARVVFRNEQTQEYLYYVVTFKATPPGVISMVDMTTPVRQSITRTLTLENPLSTPVQLTCSCSSTDVIIPHNVVLPATSEGQIPIEYLPLRVGDQTGKLLLTSAELGVYQYDLHLVATPAGPERSMQFKVGLGASQVQTFRFLSFAKAKTEYTCRIDSLDFTVDKTVAAPANTGSAGIEVCVDVTYEPSKLGDARTTLYLSSPTGGEYTCPLFGHCVPSKPQGPFTIKAGTTASIPFKNVFAASHSFTFTVDNPAFSVKPTETIGAKKTFNVQITYKTNTPKVPRMGKLVVTSAVGGSEMAGVSWTYYLRGVGTLN